jgi:hypothetical protein
MWGPVLVFLVSLVVLQIPSWQYFSALAGPLLGPLWALALETCAVYAWTHRHWRTATLATLAVVTVPIYQLGGPRLTDHRSRMHPIDVARKLVHLHEQHLSLAGTQLTRLLQEPRSDSATENLTWLHATEQLRTEMAKSRADLIHAYAIASHSAPGRGALALQISAIVIAFGVLQTSLLSAASRLYQQLTTMEHPVRPQATTSLVDSTPILCERLPMPTTPAEPDERSPPPSTAGPRASLGPRATDLFKRMKRHRLAKQQPREN